MDNPQSNVQTEITRHLCQAHAVQIKSLQQQLPELINQTTKALEEGQPELAHSLWKQVQQTTQNISRLFNQTTAIMYQQQTSVPGSFGSQGRRFNGYNGYSGRGRQQRQSRQSYSNRQLSKIARQVDELVAAAS